MRIDRGKDEDAIYLEFTPAQAARTEQLSEQLILDYDDAGNVTGIEVLDVSHGVDLDALPAELEQQVAKALEDHNIKLLAL